MRLSRQRDAGTVRPVLGRLVPAISVAVVVATTEITPVAAASLARPVVQGRLASPSSPRNGPNGASTSTAGCGSVLFIGARGTGEAGPGTPGWPRQHYDRRDPFGLGGPVSSVRTALIADLNGRKSVVTASVDYDTTSVYTMLTRPLRYFANPQSGVDWTVTYLSRQASICPHQSIVLAGYSQGAMVMHRVMHLLGAKILARVTAAVLIADGDQIANDDITRFGTAALSAVGAGPHYKLSGSSLAPFGTVTVPRVLSVCNAGDIVCDFKKSDMSTSGVKVHLNYTGTPPVRRATRLAAIMTVTGRYTGGGIDHPQGIAAGSDGALWFTNSVGNSIGRITTSGTVTRYTDSSILDPVGIASGPDGALWFTNAFGNSIGRISTAGHVTSYTDPSIVLPFGITSGPDGALWFVNFGSDSIGRISTAGHVTSYTDPSISGPLWITSGPDGALWFTNSGSGSIGRITTTGHVTTYTSPGIDIPEGIAAGPDGALWFTSNGNNSIGRITTAGKITSYSGPGIDQPYGITAGPDGALWFTNSGSGSIGRISTAGIVTNYSGPGTDGPYDITTGRDGALWFTNAFNDSIGRNATASAPRSWGSAIKVPGAQVLNTGASAELLSVSCTSAGNCGAGGYYTDSSGNTQPMVVSETDGTWGHAAQLAGTSALNTGGSGQISSISCWSAGNCAVGGYYTDGTGDLRAFVDYEVNGTWAQAEQVPGTDPGSFVDAQVDSVSCDSTGDCAAGGSYADASGAVQAFVASGSTGSAWTAAVRLPGSAGLNAGLNAQVTSLSCASAGSCTAGGYVTDASDSTQAFVADEQGGSWQDAVEVPNSANLNSGDAQITSVSCAAPGNCGAGGFYTDGSGVSQAFVASEVKGTWGSAAELPGSAQLNHLDLSPGAAITSISCSSPGNCGAGGYYASGQNNTQAFVSSQVNGTWTSAVQAPGTGALNAIPAAAVLSVSCTSAGTCMAGGYYQDASYAVQAFVINELNGTWAKAIELPGTPSLGVGATVSAVSCAGTGVCAAGGYVEEADSSRQAMVASSG
jgi:virginiamycin B lyase